MSLNTETGYLLEDGKPNLALLNSTFRRCQPPMMGGTEWLDDVRFCRWPGQTTDGRKHDAAGDPNGKARPWENASDCRPFVVDDLINERKAMLIAAFWRSMIQPGAGDTEESGYAVALVEWLVFNKMVARLNDEVDLSADYQEHLGWCLLAPRWRRELGLKRFTLTMEQINQQAQQAGPDTPFGQLPAMILDPAMETGATEFMQAWYDWYVNTYLPEDLKGRAPKITEAVARKAVRALRTEAKATVAIPYLCSNELTIEALKPWTEAFLPLELTDANEIVFQVERVTEAELKGRELGLDYDPEWIEAALEHKGEWSVTALPTGTMLGFAGLTGASTRPSPGSGGMAEGEGAVELIHAIYRAADEDGIPSIYCTTFHREVTTKKGTAKEPLYALHQLAESADGELPYVACLRERWSRSLTSSRGVPEMAHTQQNLVKGFLDSMLDLASISILPPLNVYESPTGAERTYNYAPGVKNFTRKDREPTLMDLGNRSGMVNGLEAYELLRKTTDNRFAALSEEVPAVRQQLQQEHAVRRFLLSWSRAFKQGLCLYLKHGDDAEFARVTGAPDGWLDAHRDTPGILTCALDFDVRELDSEMEMKRIESMNKIVLPNDVLGVINRGAWATEMTRGILGPRRAKRLVRPIPEASAALRDKARGEVAQMFLGNSPTFLDDKDPTAAGLLNYTQEIVMQNPVYLSALTDEALIAVAGDKAQMIAEKLPRKPDARFSGLLLKWLENLKFIGVTQPANKQIGRIGVDPEGA